MFFRFFRKKISYLGKEQQKVSGKMIKWVNQGLGASKEVKVSGKEDFFINAYTKQSQINANNSRYMKMLEQVPRLFIETIIGIYCSYYDVNYCFSRNEYNTVCFNNGTYLQWLHFD